MKTIMIFTVVILSAASAFAQEITICTATCYRAYESSGSLNAVSEIASNKHAAIKKLNSKCHDIGTLGFRLSKSGFLNMAPLISLNTQQNLDAKILAIDESSIIDNAEQLQNICSSLSL